MANPQRLRRVADQIQRELSDLIRNELKDPRVGMVTITGVEMSPDLTHAKVFFTSLVDGAQTEALEGLRRSAGFLRSNLGRRIKIQTTPELHFEYDASIAEGVRLSNLIDQAIQSTPEQKE
jgi:ribosome-binding factor A